MVQFGFVLCVLFNNNMVWHGMAWHGVAWSALLVHEVLRLVHGGQLLGALAPVGRHPGSPGRTPVIL